MKSILTLSTLLALACGACAQSAYFGTQTGITNSGTYPYVLTLSPSGTTPNQAGLFLELSDYYGYAETIGGSLNVTLSDNGTNLSKIWKVNFTHTDNVTATAYDGGAYASTPLATATAPTTYPYSQSNTGTNTTGYGSYAPTWVMVNAGLYTSVNLIAQPDLYDVVYGYSDAEATSTYTITGVSVH